MQKEDILKFEEAWARRGKEELIKAVPLACRDVPASGTPEEVQKRVQAFRDVGVDLPILRSAAKHQATRLMEMFAPTR